MKKKKLNIELKFCLVSERGNRGYLLLLEVYQSEKEEHNKGLDDLAKK